MGVFSFFLGFGWRWVRFLLPLNVRPGRKNASCLSRAIYLLALGDVVVFEVLTAVVYVLVVACGLVLRRGARHPGRELFIVT